MITSRIFDPEPSAASLRLSTLAAELATQGADVRVLTTRVPRGMRSGPDTRADVRRWPVLRDRSGYVRGYLPYLSFDVPLLFRILFGGRGDVYLCEPPPTTGFFVRLACWVVRRPYVYYGADIWSDAAHATGAPGFVLGAVRRLEAFAMSGAGAVIAVTEGVAERVRALAPGSRVHVVGHGVDTERFSPDATPVDLPADIVYVGSASEWHGAELAVDAVVEVLERHPKLTAAFIGQGSSWPTMRSTVEDAGLSTRIRFVDTVPADRAAGWLRGARVSVATLVPGQGYDFAVPTKIYASVAVGTPVAYAGPDPVRALIDRERLGRGTAYDRAALVSAIDELLADRSDASARLSAWAEENVSARVVARRSADVIMAVARRGGIRSGDRR